MNRQSFNDHLLNHIHIHHRTLRNFAKSLSVSTAYISAVVNSEKPPSKKILDALNMEKETHYIAGERRA